ncbi:MAG: peptidylprolyl isomerase, partial [Planctomycetota bacterium]
MMIRKRNGNMLPGQNQRKFDQQERLARQQFTDLFDLAYDLYQGPPKGFRPALQFVVAALGHREQMDILEGSLQPAIEVCDGLRDSNEDVDRIGEFRQIFAIAARASFNAGKFDQAKKLFEEWFTLAQENEEDPPQSDIVMYGLLDRCRTLWDTELQRRAAEDQADDLPQIKLETTRGDVILELFENECPNTVAQFVTLVEEGFYDGNDFHQVVEHMLALTGDKNGDGSAATDGPFLADENQGTQSRFCQQGSLVMAKIPIKGKKGEFYENSASTQFAILLQPVPTMMETQTIFGRVKSGMDAITSLRRADSSKKKDKNTVVLPSDRIVRATVLRKRDHAYLPRLMQSP